MKKKKVTKSRSEEERALHRQKCKQYGRTMGGFLNQTYRNMRARVEGRSARSKESPHLWMGKPILPRETFLEWSRNHPDFLRVFKRWANNDYERRLTPSINRINSKLGYTLNNMEWVTLSQNSMMASETYKLKSKKAVYELLGVK